MKDEGCKDDPGVLLLGFGCASAPNRAFRGRSPRLAHIAKGAMYAPPGPGGCPVPCQPLGTKPECVLESTVSQIALPSRIGRAARKMCAAQRQRPEEGLGGAHVAVFAMCASRGRSPRLARITKGVIDAPPDRVAQW